MIDFNEFIKYTFVEHRDLSYGTIFGVMLTFLADIILLLVPWIVKGIKSTPKFIWEHLHKFYLFIKCGYFTPIPYNKFHGNVFCDDSALRYTDVQKIKICRKYREPFNTLIYCINTNQGRNPTNNHDTESFKKLIEYVYQGLSYLKKCKINRIYNREQKKLKELEKELEKYK